MDIKFEKLKSEYAASLAMLDKLCFGIPWSKESFEYAANDDNAYYVVAILNDEVIGYCGVNVVAKEGYITNLAVHPNYRKKGIASKLMELIINYSLDCNSEFVTLEVRESNSVAINLYKKFGFRKVGERKNYYSDNRETAVLMTKYF